MSQPDPTAVVVAREHPSFPVVASALEKRLPSILAFLGGNEQLKGILNAGYKKKTAFVLRAVRPRPSNANAPALYSITSKKSPTPGPNSHPA